MVSCMKKGAELVHQGRFLENAVQFARVRIPPQLSARRVRGFLRVAEHFECLGVCDPPVAGHVNQNDRMFGAHAVQVFTSDGSVLFQVIVRVSPALDPLAGRRLVSFLTELLDQVVNGIEAGSSSAVRRADKVPVEGEVIVGIDEPG